MKHKLFLALLLVALSSSAWAYCRTYTIIKDGTITTCQECCMYDQCTVTCF